MTLSAEDSFSLSMLGGSHKVCYSLRICEVKQSNSGVLLKKRGSQRKGGIIANFLYAIARRGNIKRVIAGKEQCGGWRSMKYC